MAADRLNPRVRSGRGRRRRWSGARYFGLSRSGHAFLQRRQLGQRLLVRIRVDQVVTGRQVLGMWESESGAELKIPLGEVLGDANTGIAIVVQQERGGMPGSILAAAAYEP